MSGSRTKKLRKEAYPIYLQAYKRFGRRMIPFKSVFRQIKKLYKLGLPIYQKKTVGLA